MKLWFTGVIFLLVTNIWGLNFTQGEYPYTYIFEAPKKLRLCVVGDVGKGNDEQYEVARKMAKDNCDQVRVLGDLVYSSGIKNEKDPLLKERFFKPYAKLFNNEREIPFFLTLGNHDYDGNPKAWLKVSKKKKKVFFPNEYYAELWGKLCFISFDFMTYSEEQVKWFDGALNYLKESGCTTPIMWSHFPYISSGRHGDAAGVQKDFYEKHVVGKVKFIWAGHDHHMSYEKPISGMHMIVSGGGGASLSVKSKKGRKKSEKKAIAYSERHGYFLFDITEGEKAYKFTFWMRTFRRKNFIEKILKKKFKWSEKGPYLVGE